MVTDAAGGPGGEADGQVSRPPPPRPRRPRRWAVRSFALAFAAVTPRLYPPLSGLPGLPFEVAHPLAAWLCWVPNLLLAERAPGRTAPISGRVLGALLQVSGIRVTRRRRS